MRDGDMTTDKNGDRRYALTRMTSGVAHAARRIDRAFPFIVAGFTLLIVVAATVYQEIEKSLRPRPPTPTTPKADVIAYRVEKTPVREPDSPVWSKVTASKLQLADQSITKPLKLDVPKEPLTVRAAHDGEWIAFLLEWKDESREQLTIKVREFRDACAVLLTKHPAPPEARFMGTKENPATIIHWKADWQLDVEEGFQDLEKAFPNVSADVYPPLKEAVVEGKPPRTEDYPEAARTRLAGWYVGNILSQPKKSTVVEKIVAIGPGTITTLPTQDAEGWGTWNKGVWRVVLAKKMTATDSGNGELTVASGNMYSVAFTVWFGHQGDRGARKNPSMLHTLYVE